MYAIGANQHVTALTLAVVKMNFNRQVVLFESNATRIKMNRIWLKHAHCIEQCAVKVRTVNHEIGSSVTGARYRPKIE